VSSLKTIYDLKRCTHCCIIDGGLSHKTFPFSVIIGYFDEKLINFQKMMYEYALKFLFYFILFYFILFYLYFCGRKDLSLSSFLSKLSLHR
jgi:hypothetical protein